MFLVCVLFFCRSHLHESFWKCKMKIYTIVISGFYFIPVKYDNSSLRWEKKLILSGKSFVWQPFYKMWALPREKMIEHFLCGQLVKKISESGAKLLFFFFLKKISLSHSQSSCVCASLCVSVWVWDLVALLCMEDGEQPWASVLAFPVWDGALICC